MSLYISDIILYLLDCNFSNSEAKYCGGKFSTSLTSLCMFLAFVTSVVNAAFALPSSFEYLPNLNLNA